MDIFQAALIGYESERQRIEESIADLQKRLGNRRSTAIAPEPTSAPRKRIISPEGLRRIQEGQKKRWAAARKSSGKAAPTKAAAKPAGKRKLSAEQKAALIERLKKARAAKAGKKSEGEPQS